MTNPAPVDAPAPETPTAGADPVGGDAPASSTVPADADKPAPTSGTTTTTSAAEADGRPATGDAPVGGTTPAADAPTGTATGDAPAGGTTPAADAPATGSGATAAADADGKPSRAAQLARQYVKPVPGVKGLVRGQPTAAMRIANAASGALAKNAGEGVKTAAKWGARTLPFVGSIAAGVMAYYDYKDGDFVGGTLNLIGAIPGPVGWVGMGAGALWNEFFDESIGMWDAPDGTTTFMLPGAAAEFAGVEEADAALTAAQRNLYAYADGPTGSVWDSSPPDALKLNTEPVAVAARAWLEGLSSLFTKVESTLTASEEPYFAETAAKLAPHLKAMADLTPACTALLAQLGEVDTATAAAYKSVLAVNQSLRVQLSENGELSDAGPASTLTSALQTAQTAITAANNRIGEAFPAAPPVLMPAAPAVVTPPSAPAPAPAPAPLAPATPVAPGSTAPGAPGGAKPEDKSDIGKLLDSLGKTRTPAMPQVPQMGGNPLGGGGNPLGGMGGGNPMGNGQGRRLDDGEGRRFDDKRDRGLDDAKEKREEEKAKRKLSTTPSNATTGPAPAPAAPVAPAPVAAAPAVTHPVKPEAAPVKPGEAVTTKGPTTVDVKGEKVTFPPDDAKLAKLAQLLAHATPQQPMSLADAAAASGLTPPVPGQDPGQQVPPASAKPGDVLVVGDKSFMLLGEGRFYDLQTYTTVGAADLPADAGSRGGYFHLGDPAAQTSAPGGGAPVSPPPAAGVPFDVPGGQPPAQTVDASPAAAGGAPDRVDNPEAAGHPPSTPPTGPAGGGAPPMPGGIPSSGSPGVPAAGNGNGPANAAGTATGVGQPAPAAKNTAPLDPSAVK